SAHTAPASTPIASAPQVSTNAQAGVIATRPATTPDAAPRLVAWPSRSRSISSQPSIAAQVAVKVLMNATPASAFAASAEPALNPNQPNHSSPAPSITSVRLCGFIDSLGQPARRPRTSASASAAAPALMCTAVPPAKSSAARLLAIQPPTWPESVLKSNTQCATGKYTSVAHRAQKTSHALN